MANTVGTNATAKMLSGPTTKAANFSTNLQCAQVRSIFFSKVCMLCYSCKEFSFYSFYGISCFVFFFSSFISIYILRRLFRAPRKNRTIFVKRVSLYYSQVWSSNYVCWWLLCITRIKAQNATLLAPAPYINKRTERTCARMNKAMLSFADGGCTSTPGTATCPFGSCARVCPRIFSSFSDAASHCVVCSAVCVCMCL